jgi:adenylate cyclase
MPPDSAKTGSTLGGKIRGVFSSWEFLFIMGLTCVISVLYLLAVPLLEHIELKCWDLHFTSRGIIKPSGQVAFVTVDEESVKREGRWPWPRRDMARLLQAVDSAGALVIGLDFGFFEPDLNLRRKAILDLREQLERHETGAADLIENLETIAAGQDEDRILAGAIEGLSAPLVIGQFFYSTGSLFVPEPPPMEALDKAVCRVVLSKGPTPEGKLLEQEGIESNIAIISEAAPYSGSFNVFPDPDGSIRWMPLIVRYNGRIFPSLALQMLSAALPDTPPIIKLDERGVEGIRLGAVTIPTNSRGELLVNFYGPGYSFPHYSATALMRGEIPPETLKDKLVVVGITTMGLHDFRPTPFDPIFPGVELHCTVMDNFIQQYFVKRPAGSSQLLDLGALAGIALIFLVAQWFARGIVLVGIAAGLLAGYAGLTHYVFVSRGLWLNNIYPCMSLVLAYSGTTMHHYLKEEREKRHIRKTFSLYVPHSVVEEMLANPEMLRLGGDKRELSILFSDIRGFTTLSEKRPAEELVPELNNYFTQMTEVVFHQKGTLDKYIGDAIMALFGAPLPQEDHACRACATALEMMNQLRVLQEEWRNRRLPVLDIGIGINTGVAIVGNMGSARRFDYTAIGDNVNLASRLESLTKKYGVSILIGESTCEEAKDRFVARDIDIVCVKGKEEPVKIYQLLCHKEREPDFCGPLETWSRAIDLFRRRKWIEALDLFTEIAKIWPADPPALIYQQRCTEYLIDPPPESWSCVTMLDIK